METLTLSTENIKTLANSITEKTFQNRYSMTLDCKYLPPSLTEENIFEEPALEGFFKLLMNIHNPTLYWFAIRSNHDSQTIYEEINTARKFINRRFPAQTEYRGSTKVLYVGKVNSDIVSRMITHLGYDERPDRQGLQLSHWAKKMGLKLELKIMVLPKELKDFIYYFESQLSRELNPLIGKY